MSAAKLQRLALPEDLTIYEVRQVRRQLAEALDRHTHLCLDLAGVTEFDTAGLQLLLVARRQVQAAGGMLQLDNAGPAVQALTRLYGLDPGLGDAREDRDGSE